MSDPLPAERAAVLAQIEAVSRDFDAVVDASESSNADDDRKEPPAPHASQARRGPLQEGRRRRLADVDAALARRETGAYGRCEQCGRPIGAERLAARPSVRTCIECAR